MTVEDYATAANAFLCDGRHPTLGRGFRDCGYLPMIELLRYLEANGFTTFIASGGDRDFMRPVTEEIYGIPVERVIGSSTGLRYQEDESGGSLVYSAELDVFDDGPPSRYGSGVASGEDRSWPAATQMGISRCCTTPAPPPGPPCVSWYSTTTPSASSTTPPAPRSRSNEPTRKAGQWSVSRTTGARSSPTPAEIAAEARIYIRFRRPLARAHLGAPG